MNLPVRLRALARLEYDRVANEYESLSPGLGIRFTRAIDRVIERVGRFPRLYGVLFRGVRCATIRRFPFIVLYRITKDEVVVLAILPSQSNPIAWRNRV